MIDFLKYRFVCFITSLLFIAGISSFCIYKYQTQGHIFNYSVDFTGGTQVLFRFSNPMNGEQIKDLLITNGWQSPIIREFSGGTDFLVRIKEFSSDAAGLAVHMQQALQASLPDTQVTLLQNESVGAGVGADLRWKSIRAIIISLIGILLYIALRFWSLSFGLGAVIALFHDAIVMLAVLLILDQEISINTIGAILAVLGYSVNDTIVIFSVIRDRLASGTQIMEESLYDIVNKSLNKTLRRTLLTSFATALTVCSMLFLGGQALRNFSLTLMIGIIFGTYSSIYIASPVMMLLYKKNQ